MIFERTLRYSSYTPNSIYFTMAAPCEQPRGSRHAEPFVALLRVLQGLAALRRRRDPLLDKLSELSLKGLHDPWRGPAKVIHGHGT